MSKFVTYPLYSDFFDFYPITVTKDNDGFLTHTPSLLGYDNEPEKFTGQTSPFLASPGRVQVDRIRQLYDQLHKTWERRYLRKRYGEWSTQVLFRSLEMAYQASTMPFRNHSTLYDYGANVSLWVSAFEILSHPKKGKANLITVIDLLEKYDWFHKDLRRRSYVLNYGGKRRQINFSQKLYKELYDTRNTFLHGNPVTLNRLRPFRNRNAQAIKMFAPLLYKVAWSSYLSPIKDQNVKNDRLRKYTLRSINERNLSEALLKAKNPDTKR